MEAWNSVWNKPITCKLSLKSKVVKMIYLYTPFFFINVHSLSLIKFTCLQQSIFHISGLWKGWSDGSHCLQKKAHLNFAKTTWQNVLWSDETKIIFWAVILTEFHLSA